MRSNGVVFSALVSSIFYIVFLMGCAGSVKQPTMLTKAQLSLVNDTVCEIVIKKPVKDSLTYEKDIQEYIEILPLWFRTDEYLPIGTAFAISKTRMLTALHALGLQNESLMHKKFYIRDANKRVYEISDIYKLNSFKDIVEFEAEGKTFDRWLTLEDTAEMNTPVVSVGSVAGEGIIKRSGLLTSEKTNEVDGRQWDIISFSADASPGNSGGPLLNMNGNVIGIILARDEENKLGFALPVSETLTLEENVATIYQKNQYSFALFSDKRLEQFEKSISLPKSYPDLRMELVNALQDWYRDSMDKLFESKNDSLFPDSESSKEALLYLTDVHFPSVYYENKKNKKWTLSEKTKLESVDLPDNGSIRFGSTGPLLFLDLNLPDGLSLEENLSNPKQYMDLILKGMPLNRVIARQEIRITSLGDPFKTYDIRDRYGRKWLVGYWLMEYNDMVVMLYSLPTPEGCMAIFKVLPSVRLTAYEYDLRKVLDYITLGYYGTFEEWEAFLMLKDYIPDYFKMVNFSYKDQKKVKISTDSIALSYDPSVLKISKDSDLFIDMTVQRRKDEIVWAPRSFYFGENKNTKSLISVYSSLKPPEDGVQEWIKSEWSDIVNQTHPRDGKPFYDKKLTKISSLHRDFLKMPKKRLEKEEKIYTVKISLEDKVDDKIMIKKLNKFNKNIEIR